jgi:hypothetical protein
MRSEIVVQRRFPTYDFVIRTPLATAAVMSVLQRAIIEPRWYLSLRPSPLLVGKVDGSTFKCRPETTMFGGNAVPLVRGQIVTRADGGTDILIRAIDWFIYIVPTPFMLLGLYWMIFSAEERWGGAKMFCGTLVVALMLYFIEVTRVRRLFEHFFPT